MLHILDWIKYLVKQRIIIFVANNLVLEKVAVELQRARHKILVYERDMPDEIFRKLKLDFENITTRIILTESMFYSTTKICGDVLINFDFPEDTEEILRRIPLIKPSTFVDRKMITLLQRNQLRLTHKVVTLLRQVNQTIPPEVYREWAYHHKYKMQKTYRQLTKKINDLKE